jgi:hypothetical protein
VRPLDVANPQTALVRQTQLAQFGAAIHSVRFDGLGIGRKHPDFPLPFDDAMWTEHAESVCAPTLQQRSRRLVVGSAHYLLLM